MKTFESPAFRALAATITPEAARLGDADWVKVARIVDDALADRPPAIRRQLGILIGALQWLPLARYGKPFTALDSVRRERFLSSIQDSPVLLLRRGFWGLRTLVFMGYYGRPEAAAEIGYRADPRGWEVRR